MLNVYVQWIQNSCSPEWCRKHFLHFKKLQKVREIRSQIVEIMKKNRHSITSCRFDHDIVRKVICSAYFTNAAKCKTIGQYVNLRTGVAAFIHPSSCLFELGSIPDYIVYHE
uniref:Pre-mRNA-splicing factor ATP-dependent RNA helicase PRP16 n=1 Tax=Lygus hesperus TaxID=30085 RepID=A0A0A9YFB1_LYGHE